MLFYDSDVNYGDTVVMNLKKLATRSHWEMIELWHTFTSSNENRGGLIPFFITRHLFMVDSNGHYVQPQECIVVPKDESELSVLKL